MIVLINNCIPLILTNQYGNKYIDIWDELTNLHRIQKNRSLEERKTNDITADLIKLFNSKYEQVAKIYNYGKTSENIKDIENLSKVHMSEFLYEWRIHKQVYKFPSELEKLLYEQETGIDTPIGILKNLPYDCIYIETSNISYNEKCILGFFAKRTDGTINLNGSMMYEFCIIYEDLSSDFVSIRYDESTMDRTSIYDAIVNTMLKEVKLISTKTGEEFSYEDPEVLGFAKESLLDMFENTFWSVLPRIIQLVLYICAENKEVEENLEQKKITRKPKDKKFIKDKYREVQIWDCGNKISEKIRTFLVKDRSIEIYSESNISRVGSPKSPHSRRGHWHHFWIGKVDTEERKLILKWVAPTFVNGSPNTVNINKVEVQE